MAQSVTFWHGAEPTRLGRGDEAGASWPLGKIGADYGVIRNEHNADLDVCLTDELLNVKKSAVLLHSANGKVLFTALDGERLHVFLDVSTLRTFIVKEYIVNLATMKVDDTREVMDETIGFKGGSVVCCEPSPNGAFYGMVAFVYNDKTDELTAEALLYDNKAQLQWRRSFEPRPISQIKVMDDGQIVTAGYFDNLEAGTATVYFCSVDKDLFSHGSVALPHGVGGLALLNCIDGKAVAMTLNKKEEKNARVRRNKKTTTSWLTTSCTAMAYDVEQEALIHSSTYYFTHQDMQVLINDKSGVRYDDNPGVIYLDITSNAPTSYGGAAAIGQAWTQVTQNSNGSTSSYYYQEGVIVVAADTTGDIIWHRPVRHAVESAKGKNYMGSRLLSSGENVYYIATEDEECSKSYTVDAVVKAAGYGGVLKDNVMLTCYKMDVGGHVNKQVLSTSKTDFLGRHGKMASDGTYYFITGNGRQTMLNTLRFGD